MEFTKESLYEYVLRCKFLEQEAIYDDYKLDITNNKVYIVGLSSNFKYKSELVIDGSLFNVDLPLFMNEIYNYDIFWMTSLDLIIKNLKVLTKDFFGISTLNHIYQLNNITLTDTIEIKKRCFINIECNNLYAPELLKIENGAFFKSCKFKTIIAPKCKSLSFSDLRHLKYLSLLNVSSDYSLESANVHDSDVFDNYNNNYLYKLLKADDFETLNFKTLIFYLYNHEPYEMYFKKLKILYGSDDDSNIYTEYRKKYFPVYNKKVVFSSLEILQMTFYHMQFSDFLEFPVLKRVRCKSFNGCVFNTLSLNECVNIESCSFNSCKINILELSSMKSLSKGYFRNCSINKLVINKNCQINEDELIDIITEIVRV